MLPRGLLLAGPEALKEALGSFSAARSADIHNEAWPGYERLKPPSLPILSLSVSKKKRPASFSMELRT